MLRKIMRPSIVRITYDCPAAASLDAHRGAAASLAAKCLLRCPDNFSRQPSRLLR